MQKTLSDGSVAYIVSCNRKPSMVNEDAWVGAAVGNVLPIIGTVPGALLGGWLGKRRMERELTEGRIVPEPTLWNKKIAKGMLIGAIVVGVAAALIAVAYSGPILALLATKLVTVTAAPTLTGMSMLPDLTLFAAKCGAMLGIVPGAIWGAVSGKRAMRRAYEAARVAEETSTPAIRQGRSAERSPSPNLSATLPAPEKSFAAQENARRGQEAPAASFAQQEENRKAAAQTSVTPPLPA